MMQASLLGFTGDMMESHSIGLVFCGDFDCPPMQEGRFFQESDFFTQQRLAVVGQNSKHLIYDEDGKAWIALNDQSYAVIGIVGTSHVQTPLNDCIYYNLDSKESMDLLYIDASNRSQVDRAITELLLRIPLMQIDDPPNGVGRLMHHQSGNLAVFSAVFILLIIFYRCVVRLQYASMHELLEVKLLTGKSVGFLSLQASCWLMLSSLLAVGVTWLIEALLFSRLEHLLIIDRIPLDHSLLLLLAAITLPAGMYHFFYTRTRLRGAFG